MKKKAQTVKLDGEAPKCEVCATRDATVLCDEDNVRLCSVCDMTVHSANKVAQRHTRWPLCSVCHRLKATKTSTTPQEQGVNVCTSCASTVPKGKLHKMAGALAAPALHVLQAQTTSAGPFDGSDCLTDMPGTNGALSGQQVWVRDATLVLGSGIGPPCSLHQAAPAETITQPTAASGAVSRRNSQGLQPTRTVLGESCSAGVDQLNLAAEGMQLRCSGQNGGGGGADTPDVLDALFNSWGEEGGPSFEEPEVDATAAAAGDLDLSIWADSPTDAAAGAPGQPAQAAREPSPNTAAVRLEPDILGLDTAAVAAATSQPSGAAVERAEQAPSPSMQLEQQYQQQHRQPQDRALHGEEMQEGHHASAQPAGQQNVDMARNLEQPPAAGLGTPSVTFEYQQGQQHQERQCKQALCQSQQYDGQREQDALGAILRGQQHPQQQQQQQQLRVTPTSPQLAALAAMEMMEQRSFFSLQRASPASPRQHSSGSQAMDCSRPQEQHEHQHRRQHQNQHQNQQPQQPGGQLLSTDLDLSMGQVQQSASAAGQECSTVQLSKVDVTGGLARPGAEAAPPAGATAMPWLGSILGAQYQGLAPEQQLAVNSFLMKQDPAALQSSGIMGGISAAGGVALPTTGLMAPSPRQSCDGTSVLTAFSGQPQQPFHAPTSSANANTMAGGYPQPFGGCMAFLPGIRTDKGPTASLYEAALLSAAGIVNPWRSGLLSAGLPVGAGALQFPGLMAAAAAGPLQLPLPLLGPIQTLASAAWAQAAAQGAVGLTAGSGVAGSGQPLAPPSQQQQQQQAQPGEAAMGAGQHFASGGGANPAASGIAYGGSPFGAPMTQPQPQTSGLSATQHQLPPIKQEPSTSSAQGATSHHAHYAHPPQLANRISSNGRALAPPAPGPAPGPGPGFLSGVAQPAPQPPYDDGAANTSGGGVSNTAAATLGSQVTAAVHPQARPQPSQQQQQPQGFAPPDSHQVRPPQLPRQAQGQQSNGQPQGLAVNPSQPQQQPQQLQSAGPAGFLLPPQNLQQQSAQQLWQQQQQQQARGGGVGLHGGANNASALLLFNQQQHQQFQQLQQLLLQSAGQGPKNQQQLLMQLAAHQQQQQPQPQQHQQHQQHMLLQSAVPPPTAGLGVSPDTFGGMLMSPMGPMAHWLMMNMSHASSTANVQQGAAAAANAGANASLSLGLQLPPGAAAAFSSASAAAAAAAAAAVAGLTSVPAAPMLSGSQGGAVPVAAATVTAATSAVMLGPAPEASKVSRERDPRDREPRDHAERDEALTRYRQKRKTRHFEKTIRYASRQILSHKRPRIKGRFVKTQPCQAAIIGMSPVTTHEPRTSEDPEAGDEADDEQEADLELEEVEEENDPLVPGPGHGPGEGTGTGPGSGPGSGHNPNAIKPQREADGCLMMDLDGPAAAEGPQEAVAEGGLGLGLGGMGIGMEGCEDGPGCRNSCDAMEVEVSGGARYGLAPREPCCGGAGAGCGGGGCGGTGGGGGGDGRCASSGAGGLSAAAAAAAAAGRGASVGGSNEKACFQHASAGAAGACMAAIANGCGLQLHHHPHHHHAGGRHHNYHHVSSGHLAALGVHAGPPPLGMLAMGSAERPLPGGTAAALGGVIDAAAALGGGEALQLLCDMDVQLSSRTPAHAQAALSGSAHAQAKRGISGGTHGGGAEEEEEAVGPSHSVNSRLSAGSVHTPGRWRALGGANGTAAAAYEEAGLRSGAHSHPAPHAHPHQHQHDGGAFWASAGAGKGPLGTNGAGGGRQAGGNGGSAARGANGSAAAEADGTVSTNGVTKTGGSANAKASRNGNGNTAGGGGGNGSGGHHTTKVAIATVSPAAAAPRGVSPAGLMVPVTLQTPLPTPADLLLTGPPKSALMDTVERPPQISPAAVHHHLLLQRQVHQQQQQLQHMPYPQHPVLGPGAVTGNGTMSPSGTAAAVAAVAAAAVAAVNAGGCGGGAGGPGGCGGGASGARHSPKRQQTAAFDMPPCLPMPSTASCGGVSPLGVAGAGAGGPATAGRRGTPAPCCLVPDCATDAAAPCCMSGGGTTEQGSCMEDNHTLVDAETAGGGAGDGEGDSECCSAEPLVSGASNTVPSVEASTHGQGQQRIRCRRSSPQLSVRM